MFHIKPKGKDIFLDINIKNNDPFNCINITLSKSPHIWIYNKKDKIIKNNQTNGILIHKYHGWIPDAMNILLLNKNDYDIYFKPIEWDYQENILSTIINNKKYVLCVNNDNNILLKKTNINSSIHQWDLIPVN